MHDDVLCFTDENKIELETKSAVNSEVTKLITDMENYRDQLQMIIDDILDRKVAKTDMKLRHIVLKGIEVSVSEFHLIYFLNIII